MADFIIGRAWRREAPARALAATQHWAAKALGWVHSLHSAAACVGPLVAPAVHIVLALVSGEAGAW